MKEWHRILETVFPIEVPYILTWMGCVLKKYDGHVLPVEMVTTSYFLSIYYIVDVLYMLIWG